jgi:hypothetical protein
MGASYLRKALAMAITPDKAAAFVIALIYLAGSIMLGGWDTEGVAVVCLLLLLPLCFIWFPDFLHDYIGRATTFRATSETPAFMFVVVGWIWLLGYLPLLAYLLAH